MATYTTNLSTVSLCDAVTGWTELASPHSSGSTPAVDSENWIHNSNSVSQATGTATGTAAGIEFDNGSALSGWTTTSNWVIMFWSFYAAPTNLNTWANGGLRLGVGSAQDTHDMYNALGSNNYTYGGWVNTAIDPEVTADSTIGGGRSGSIQCVASLPNVLAKVSKGSPHVVDAVRYGRGDLVVTGTGSTFSGMATANDGSTARWGLFQSVLGGYLWKGLMTLGTAGASVTFSDSNKNIQVDDTPRVLAGFNAIEINNTGSSVTWTGIQISALQTSVTGSAPVSAGTFEVVDNATVTLTGCTFNDMETFVFNDGTNANTITDCTFRRCGQITQGGATFTGCLITSSDATASMLVDDFTGVTGNTFVSDGTNHAVDYGNVTASETVTWNNTLTSYASGSTGDPVTEDDTTNAAILCNVSASQKLTINVSTGATVPSIKNTGTGTVAVNSSVDVDITVKDADGNNVNTAQVYVATTEATPTVIINADTVAGAASGSYSGTTPQDVKVWIRKASSGATKYKNYSSVQSVSSSGLTLTATLIEDPNNNATT